MKKSLMSVAGLVFIGLSSAALAAPPFTKLQDRFNLADTDHNGKLTKAEAQSGMPRVAKVFDKIDTTHSGSITYSQLATFMESHRKSS